MDTVLRWNTLFDLNSQMCWYVKVIKWNKLAEADPDQQPTQVDKIFQNSTVIQNSRGLLHNSFLLLYAMLLVQFEQVILISKLATVPFSSVLCCHQLCLGSAGETDSSPQKLQSKYNKDDLSMLQKINRTERSAIIHITNKFRKENNWLGEKGLVAIKKDGRTKGWFIWG